jgi:hypothetical protein
MALFDGIKEYFASRKTKRIDRAGKLVRNAKAIREDRGAALDFLAKDVKEADQAIPLLLPRFEYSLEHGINDTREKELAQEGIVRFGEASVPFLQDWLKKTTRIAWPIKCLKALGKDSLVVDALKAALDYNDVAFDQQAVDKNYDVLCYLREYQVPEAVDQISHFLNDPDERVRFAAAEFLIAQKTDTIKPLISKFLKDDTSENRRIRQAVIQAYVDRNWTVDNPQDFADGYIADGVRVNARGMLEVRA